MTDPVVAPGALGAKSEPRGSSGNLVFDLDGVVYLGSTAIAGAGDALAELRERRYRLLFVTNNSTRSREQVAAHIAATCGFPADPADVLTSGMAAAELLAGRAKAVLTVGGAGLSVTMRAAGFRVTSEPHDADAVVVGLDRQFDYGKLRSAATAVRGGALLVATNVDPTYPTPEGLWPGGGAMVAAIATAAETTAEIAGKPYPTMRALVRSHLGAGPTWVIGDRVDTDLEMGRAEGWGRALVLSGATADAAGLAPADRPELVLDSIADLPVALG